jgi:hypothetical protein
MNKKMIVSVFGLGLLVGMLLLVATNFLIQNFTDHNSAVPQGYLYLQTQTFHVLEVWQNNETRVNDTTTILNVWYNVTYNGANDKIEMSVWKSVTVNVTTFEAYHSFNTSQAIQWAIDNTDEVVQFHRGYYNLTHSIFLKPNISLYGMGSVFTYDTRMGLFSANSNVTDIVISGFCLGELKNESGNHGGPTEGDETMKCPCSCTPPVKMELSQDVMNDQWIPKEKSKP